MTRETLPHQPPKTSGRFSRRSFFTGTALSVAGLGIYACEVERHFLEIAPRAISVRNLPEPFRGFRIAQISDIHLEWFTEDYFLRYAVHQINKLAPDMVLITGDFITNNKDGPDDRAYAAIPHCMAILQQLQCPLRYAILGNHDVAVDAPAITDALSAHGITPLVNRHAPIERGGKRLWVAGLDDCFFGLPDINLAVPDQPDGPVILMCHEPDFIETIVRHPKGRQVDLVLSGHSHGGQVRLPFFGPLELPPMGNRYPEGHYRVGETQLYVNRGLGTVGLPVRFDCPPELTHITLERA